MIIKFGDDAVDAYIRVLNALQGFTISGEWTNPGFPSDCCIVAANDLSLVICDVDDTGRPQVNSMYRIGYDEITSITVI